MPGYKFRVLLDSEKNVEIFRDIELSGESTFAEFYDTIISSFSFSGKELASFYVSNQDWDKGHEISSMDMSMGEDDQDGPSCMTDTMMKDFTADPDQKYILVYDFMRMWIFLIELIGVSMEAPEKPEVLLVVGTAPDEESKDFTDGQFETTGMLDNEEDEFGFKDHEDGFESGDFDNIDDYDI
jgi:hypothetical protein